MPVAALAAAAVIGLGLVAAGARDTRTDEPPVGPPAVTGTPSAGPDVLGVGARMRDPGSYTLDSIRDDGRPDATVDLVGEPWETWSAGAVLYDAGGTISWGFQKYEDTPIDPCRPKRHASSRLEAVDQLSSAA